MDDPVGVALANAFPDREVTDRFETGPSWNPENRTVGVALADGARAYVKVDVTGDGARISREAAVLRYVRSSRRVAVPEVVAHDPDAPVPYLATGAVDGDGFVARWDDAGTTERRSLLHRAGRTLARLHAERFATHGTVRGGDATGLDLDRGSWTTVLIRTVEEARALGTSDRLDHHFDAVIDALEANRDRLDASPAALLHGDPAMPNLFVAASTAPRGPDGPPVGLLDWEIAHVGDPVRELVRAEDQLLGDSPDSALVGAFRDGYREGAGGLPDGLAERRPIYRAVRTLGRSGFLDVWADHREESVDALAGRLDDELDRRLDAIT